MTTISDTALATTATEQRAPRRRMDPMRKIALAGGVLYLITFAASIPQLKLFAKVVEERSFAGASRALGMSVATVSRGVTRLEDRLGARLFNRTSRQVALTEFGRNLAERAMQILRDAEDAENAQRKAGQR